MERVRLGRSNLTVGCVGLGCGGHSRLGRATGASDDDAIALVRTALDLGIDFIDTARIYGTEDVVGQAIAGVRDTLVLSSKVLPYGPPERQGGPPTLIGPEAMVTQLETSLRTLQTDHIDVYHLHGVLEADYDHCVGELLPELQRQQTMGKIAHIGITERFAADTNHRMLQRALADDHFDVVMVGFNLVNHAARRSVFPATLAHDVGTLIMFAVRRGLVSAAALQTLLDAAAESRPGLPDAGEMASWLCEQSGAADLTEVAYRFCRHEPGADVILSGTGNPAHLRANVAALDRPPLPLPVLAQLGEWFEGLETLSAD